MIERVPVARGCGIERDAQRVGDLLKGQFTPNFEHHDFAQTGRQGFHGAFEFIVVRGLADGCVEPFRRGLLAAGAPVISPRKVDGPAADRGENERVIRRASVSAPPYFHQRILEHILRVRLAPRLVACEQEEAARIGFEPGAPMV